MKKLIFSFFATAFMLTSCEKVDIKQTNETIKSADSLFRAATDGIKTLDSVSVIVTDSARFNKIIKPEIEKHSRNVEDIIREKARDIDSINRELSKMRDHIEKGSEVVRSVDSAGQAIRDGGNPLETISETLSKVVKITKPSTQPQERAPETDTAPDTKTESVLPPTDNYSDDPMYKTAKLKLSVNDLSIAEEDLRMRLRGVNGEIITQNEGEQDGIRRKYFTLKVPYRNFDDAMYELERLGEITTKTVETEGRDYAPEQLCDIEITLAENYSRTDRSTSISPEKEENEGFKEESKSAFMQGWDGLKALFVVLLPYWPLFLILGISLYFYLRYKRKKEEKELMMQTKPETAYQQENTFSQPTAPVSEEPQQRKDHDDDEDPYRKYMPK